MAKKSTDNNRNKVTFQSSGNAEDKYYANEEKLIARAESDRKRLADTNLSEEERNTILKERSALQDKTIESSKQLLAIQLDLANTYDNIAATQYDQLKNTEQLYGKQNGIANQLQLAASQQQLITAMKREALGLTNDEARINARTQNDLLDINRLKYDAVKYAQKLTLFNKENIPYYDKMRGMQAEITELTEQVGKNVQGEKYHRLETLKVLLKQYETTGKLEKKNDRIEEMQGSINDLMTLQGTAAGNILSTLKDIVTNPLVIFTGLLALGVQRFETMRQRGVELAEEMDRVNKKLAGAGPYQDAIISKAKKIHSTFRAAGEGFSSSMESAVDAVQALEQQMGNINFVTSGLVDTMTKLKLSINLSDDEVAKVIDTYMTVDGLSETAAKNSANMLYSMSETVGLNPADTFREVANATGETLAHFQLGGNELNKAVIAAKRMGLGLEDVAKISKGLLDFETSIEAEMEAQMLTGMNINFNKARQFAMNKQGAKAAQEVLRQVGGLSRYQKMNIFQQEAVARATGLTVDQLLKTNKMREQEAKLAREKQEIHKDTVKMLPIVTSVMGKLETGLGVIEKIANALGDIVLDVFGVNFEQAERLIMRFIKSDTFTTGLKNILFFMKGVVEGIKDSVMYIWNLIEKVPFIGDFMKNMGKADMSGGYTGAQTGGNVIGKVLTGLFIANKARQLLGLTRLTPMWVKDVNSKGIISSLAGMFGKGGGGPAGPLTKGGLPDMRYNANKGLGGGGAAAAGLSGMQVAGYGAAALTIGKGLYDVATTTQANTGGERAANIGGALGAIGGAKAGAALGSFFGPVGTAVGAGVGALIGYVSGRLVKHVDAFKSDLDKTREKSAKNRLLHDIENNRRSSELQREQLIASREVNLSFRKLAYDTDGLTNNELKSFAKAQFDAGNVTKDQYEEAVRGTLDPLDFLRIAADGASDALGITDIKRQDYIRKKLAGDDSVYAAQQRIEDRKVDMNQLNNLSDKQIETIISTKYSMFFEKDSKKDTQAILKEMHDATGIPIKELSKAMEGISSVLSGFYITSEGKAETIAENIRDEMKLIVQSSIEADQLFLDKRNRTLSNEAEAKFPRIKTNGVETLPVTIVKEKNLETLADGGLLSGPSHAGGGIPTKFGEMEGGEAVINKRSTQMFGDQLSAINEAGGGVPISPGMGGQDKYFLGGITDFISDPIGSAKKAYKSTKKFVQKKVVPFVADKYDKYAPDVVKKVVSETGNLIDSGKEFVSKHGGDALNYMKENGGAMLDKYVIDPLQYIPGVGPSIKTMFGKEARDQYGQMWRGEMTAEDFLRGKEDPPGSGNRSGGLGQRAYSNQVESFQNLGEGITDMSQHLPQPLKFVGEIIGDIPLAASRLSGGQRDPVTGEFSADPMNSTLIDIFDPNSTMEERFNGLMDVMSVIPLPMGAIAKIAGPVLKGVVKGAPKLVKGLTNSKTAKGMIDAIKGGAKKISPKGYQAMDEIFGTIANKAKGVGAYGKKKYGDVSNWIQKKVFGNASQTPNVTKSGKLDMRFNANKQGIAQYTNRAQAGANRMKNRFGEYVETNLSAKNFERLQKVRNAVLSTQRGYIGPKGLQMKNPLNYLKYMDPSNISGSLGNLVKKFVLKPGVTGGAMALGASEEQANWLKDMLFPKFKIAGRKIGLPQHGLDNLNDLPNVKDMKHMEKGTLDPLRDTYKAGKDWYEKNINQKKKFEEIYNPIQKPIYDPTQKPNNPYENQFAQHSMSGNSTTVGDTVLTKDGKMIQTHPDDNLIAKKGEVNVNNGGGRSRVEELLQQLIEVTRNVQVQIDGKAVAQSVNSANYVDS